jgi:hypothetical protein
MQRKIVGSSEWRATRWTRVCSKIPCSSSSKTSKASPFHTWSKTSSRLGLLSPRPCTAGWTTSWWYCTAWYSVFSTAWPAPA